MFPNSVELLVGAVKLLKCLRYDLSAIKLAQPNPWLENYKFPQMGIQADVHYYSLCNVKVPL